MEGWLVYIDANGSGWDIIPIGPNEWRACSKLKPGITVTNPHSIDELIEEIDDITT